MAMNLERRLRSLERAVVPEGAYCATCGFDPTGPVEMNVTFDEPEETGPCPACGRSPTIIRIEFDSPRGPGEMPLRRDR